MRLIFLGSGSAFTVGDANYHSNMLLEDKDGKHLLIDCGSDARLALYELGYTYKEIENLYISHLHADHVGGMEWLAITRYFDPDCKLPNLFISEELVSELWNRVLSGGLTYVEGVTPGIDTFFNVYPIAKHSSFKWSNIELIPFKTIHIRTERGIMPSYGLFIKADNINVFITTDAQFSPDQMNDVYQKSDIIFHDCETSAIISGVHARYEDLATLDPSIKNKMWLYHYNPGKLPNAKKEGFRGFVKKGQIFDFNDEKTLF